LAVAPIPLCAFVRHSQDLLRSGGDANPTNPEPSMSLIAVAGCSTANADKGVAHDLNGG
jgi:hypothetical protein